MALPKGKGGLALVLGDDAMDGAPEDDAPMDVGTASAEEFSAAVDSKDPARIKAAFKAMYEECMAEGDMGDDE
jgi:hypothetical protein